MTTNTPRAVDLTGRLGQASSIKDLLRLIDKIEHPPVDALSVRKFLPGLADQWPGKSGGLIDKASARVVNEAWTVGARNEAFRQAAVLRTRNNRLPPVPPPTSDARTDLQVQLWQWSIEAQPIWREDVLKNAKRSVALKIREFLRFVGTLDTDAAGNRVCPDDRPTLETKWVALCEAVNEARRELAYDVPSGPGGLLDFTRMPDADREVWDILSQALWQSGITRYTPDGKPWLQALAGSVEPPPVGLRVVEADRIRKLGEIADMLDPKATVVAEPKLATSVHGAVGPESIHAAFALLADRFARAAESASTDELDRRLAAITREAGIRLMEAVKLGVVPSESGWYEAMMERVSDSRKSDSVPAHRRFHPFSAGWTDPYHSAFCLYADTYLRHEVHLPPGGLSAIDTRGLIDAQVFTLLATRAQASAECCLVISRRVRTESPAAERGVPVRSTGTRAQRMTKGEANVRARELVSTNPEFVEKTAKQWSKEIGCSVGLVAELPMWKSIQERKKENKRGRAPKAVSLSHKLEASIGSGGKVGRAIATGQKDGVLEQLIRDQESEHARDPSPLEPDAPDEPRKPRQEKVL